MTTEAATKPAKVRSTQDAPKATERKPVIVSPDAMQLAEMRHTDWHLTVPAGVDAVDLHMLSDPWAACAHNMGLGDRLTIVTADDKLLLLGVCVYGNRGTKACVAITDRIELPQLDEAEGSVPGYSIRRTTSQEQATFGNWVVVRDEDGHILSYGTKLLSKLDAIQYRDRHPAVRALGTAPMHTMT